MPLLPYDYLHLVNCPEVVIISDILCTEGHSFHCQVPRGNGASTMGFTNPAAASPSTFMGLGSAASSLPSSAPGRQFNIINVILVIFRQFYGPFFRVGEYLRYSIGRYRRYSELVYLNLILDTFSGIFIM